MLQNSRHSGPGTRRQNGIRSLPPESLVFLELSLPSLAFTRWLGTLGRLWSSLRYGGNAHTSTRGGHLASRRTRLTRHPSRSRAAGPESRFPVTPRSRPRSILPVETASAKQPHPSVARAALRFLPQTPNSSIVSAVPDRASPFSPGPAPGGPASPPPFANRR